MRYSFYKAVAALTACFLLLATLIFPVGAVDGAGQLALWRASHPAKAAAEFSSDFTPISDFAGLEAMRKNPAGHYYLAADLTAPETAFAPIGTADAPFTGILDGNGHTLTGLRLEIEHETSADETVLAGLFGAINTPAEIRNLALEDLSLTVRATMTRVRGKLTVYGGGVAGWAKGGSLAGLYLSGDVAVESPNADKDEVQVTIYAGCVAGNCFVPVSDTVNAASLRVTATGGTNGVAVRAGGLLGSGSGTATLTDCRNFGAVTLNATLKNLNPDSQTGSGATGYAGGLAGSASGALTGCCNEGEISATVTGEAKQATLYAGGLVGSASEAIVDCRNTAQVTGRAVFTGKIVRQSGCDAYVGGIAGHGGRISYEAVRAISGCENSGAVTAESTQAAYCGGILGDAENYQIHESRNTGAVTSRSVMTEENGDPYALFVQTAKAGGIAGQLQKTGKTEVRDCANEGDVSATAQRTTAGDAAAAYAGGIVADNSATVDACYSTGSVSSEASHPDASLAHRNAGGIAGSPGSKTPPTNCYYLDTALPEVERTNDAGASRTAEQMRDPRSFAGFEFGDVWSPPAPYPGLVALQSLLIGDVDLNGEVADPDVGALRGMLLDDAVADAPETAEVNGDAPIDLSDLVALHLFLAAQ